MTSFVPTADAVFTQTAKPSIYISTLQDNIQVAPLGGGKARSGWNALGSGGPATLATAGRYLYWTNNGAPGGDNNLGVINRTMLTGRGLKQKLAGATNTYELDTFGNTLYWAGENAIGSSTLAGGNANQNLVANTAANSLAVNSNYIYWTTAAGTAIGRANLNGSSPNPNFIASLPGGVNSLEVTNNYLYWTNAAGTAIGRANLDGSSPNGSFITGQAQVGDLAVNGNYLYWTNLGGQIGPCGGASCIPTQPGKTAGSIGRANIDGSGVKTIVRRLNNPSELAVSSYKSPQKKHKRHHR